MWAVLLFASYMNMDKGRDLTSQRLEEFRPNAANLSERCVIPGKIGEVVLSEVSMLAPTINKHYLCTPTIKYEGTLIFKQGEYFAIGSYSMYRVSERLLVWSSLSALCFLSLAFRIGRNSGKSCVYRRALFIYSLISISVLIGVLFAASQEFGLSIRAAASPSRPRIARGICGVSLGEAHAGFAVNPHFPRQSKTFAEVVSPPDLTSTPQLPKAAWTYGGKGRRRRGREGKEEGDGMPAIEIVRSGLRSL